MRYEQDPSIVIEIREILEPIEGDENRKRLAHYAHASISWIEDPDIRDERKFVELPPILLSQNSEDEARERVRNTIIRRNILGFAAMPKDYLNVLFECALF